MKLLNVLLSKVIVLAGLIPPIHSAFAQPWIFSSPVPGPQAFVASSADGTRLAVLAYGSFSLFTSTDSGATWNTNNLPANHWTSLASSADGVNSSPRRPNARFTRRRIQVRRGR